jgi:hypothetical protein
MDVLVFLKAQIVPQRWKICGGVMCIETHFLTCEVDREMEMIAQTRTKVWFSEIPE